MPRLLLFVCVLLLVDTSGYATISPLLPGLAEEHDLGKALAGVLAEAYAAGTLVFALPGAALAARIGARPTVLVGLGLLGAASLAFGLADSGATLIGARFVQGVGGACTWAGGMAWLVAATPAERRAEAIGTAMGAAIAGALVGPVLGVLADAVGLLTVFGGFIAAPALLALWALRLRPPERVPGLGLRALRGAVTDAATRTGSWLIVVVGLTFGVIAVLVPLELDDLGATAAAVGATFLAAAGLEALAAPFAGRLADRRGRLLPARIGVLGIALAALVLPVPTTAWLLAAVVVLSAPVIGALWAPAMALVSDGVEARGLDPAFGAGLTNLAWGIGATIGGTGAGALAQATGDAVPYAVLLVLSVATLAVLTLGGRAGDAVVAHRAGGV